jgi:hypothetical protein
MRPSLLEFEWFPAALVLASEGGPQRLKPRAPFGAEIGTTGSRALPGLYASRVGRFPARNASRFGEKIGDSIGSYGECRDPSVRKGRGPQDDRGLWWWAGKSRFLTGLSPGSE